MCFFQIYQEFSFKAQKQNAKSNNNYLKCNPNMSNADKMSSMTQEGSTLVFLVLPRVVFLAFL